MTNTWSETKANFNKILLRNTIVFSYINTFNTCSTLTSRVNLDTEGVRLRPMPWTNVLTPHGGSMRGEITSPCPIPVPFHNIWQPCQHPEIERVNSMQQSDRLPGWPLPLPLVTAWWTDRRVTGQTITVTNTNNHCPVQVLRQLCKCELVV